MFAHCTSLVTTRVLLHEEDVPLKKVYVTIREKKYLHTVQALLLHVYFYTRIRHSVKEKLRYNQREEIFEHCTSFVTTRVQYF
jgi:hypothetical protein